MVAAIEGFHCTCTCNNFFYNFGHLWFSLSVSKDGCLWNHTCTWVEHSILQPFTNVTTSYHHVTVTLHTQFCGPLLHKSTTCVLYSRLHFIVSQNVCGVFFLCVSLQKKNYTLSSYTLRPCKINFVYLVWANTTPEWWVGWSGGCQFN